MAPAAAASSAAAMQPLVSPPLPSSAWFLMELPLVHYLASGYQLYRQYLFSHPSIASFLNAADASLLRLLAFYNPTLPATQRVSASWPLMRPADLVIVIMTYLSFVACVFVGRALGSRASTPMLLKHPGGKKVQLAKQQLQQKQKHDEEGKQHHQGQPQDLTGKKKHPLLEKMGVTLVVQSIYNLTQVCVCSYVFYNTLVVFVTEGYTITFNKFDPSRTTMAEIVWLFYLTKIFDLADTLLIVWRGKWNQFSFLHVYHHASIIYMMWVNASVAYDGDIYFAVLANAGIHVVMYTYYLMASWSLSIASKMKKFVTQGQMTQFLCMLFQGIYHSFFYYACEYPFRVAIGYMLYITSMYVLFAQFSKKTYGSSAKTISGSSNSRSSNCSSDSNSNSSTITTTGSSHTNKVALYHRLCKTLGIAVTPSESFTSTPQSKISTPVVATPNAFTSQVGLRN